MIARSAPAALLVACNPNLSSLRGSTCDAFHIDPGSGKQRFLGIFLEHHRRGNSPSRTPFMSLVSHDSPTAPPGQSIN